MDQQPVQKIWGFQQNLAPTQRRTDPYAFLTGCLVLGGMVAAASLWILWRPIPFLELPRGSLTEHIVLAGKWLLHLGLPHAFVKDADWYAAFVAGQPVAVKIGMALRLGISLALGTLPAFVLVPRSHLVASDAMIDIRGAKRFELNEGARELAQHIARIPNATPDLPFCDQVPYPSQLWTQHVLVVGGVGAGKSTFMRPLLSRIVASGDRLLCFDPKGEFTAAFPSTVIVAPWDERSYAWDIARDMRNVGDMERFAAALIQDSQDPMWSNAARGLLVGFLVYLKAARGLDWTWQDLADLVSLPEEDILPLMQRYYAEASRCIANGSVTTKGILINMEAFCRPIFHLARAWGEAPKERRISFVQWTKDENGPQHANAPARQIMLQGNGAYPELTRAYVEGIISVVSGIVNSVELDDDPARKIWIVADEFAQMGKIPVRPLFEVGRSRGVRCIVACQDFAQLEEVHGKEGTRALVSMCGTLMVGRVGPGETAETLSRNLGNREVERSNVSTSYDGKAGSTAPTTTLTYSRDSLALYVPSELASRLGDKPALKGCVFAVTVQGKVFEILWPYFPMPKKRKAHVPAPWTLGSSAVQTVETAGPASPTAAQVGKLDGVATGTVSRVSQADSTNLLASHKADFQRAAPSQTSFSKSSVTVVTTVTDGTPQPTDLGAAPSSQVGHGVDGLEAVQELTISHDPAETATHLALKAIEMLKARAGPLQHVLPNSHGGPPSVQ